MPALTAPLASPLFEGSGLSPLVPGKYDCALDGIEFMYDWRYPDRFRRSSIPLLKPQQDTSGNVSEASLNPSEFARRATESWHHGAGQTFLDRGDSDPFRFRSSKGVDPWTRNQLTLLNDTDKKFTSTNSNLQLATTDDRIYVLDGSELFWTSDITPDTPAWHGVTGRSGQTILGVASDGFYVYDTEAVAGVYITNSGSATTASYNPRPANGGCWYVHGRLIIGNFNDLVNITSGATEKIILHHPNDDFRVVDCTEGPGFIYAAGYSGDKGIIYKTAILPDGTDLAIMTVAGVLPDGEVPRSIEGYLGFLLVGTDKGLRLVALDASGNVASMGKVLPTTSPVYALEPQDRFVWYGLTNYDAVSTGLGRADLGAFTDDLTPAYASDVMASAQGIVRSAATFQSLRVFTVDGVGVFAEDPTNKVASATVDSGLVTYGLPDRKVAMYLDSRFAPPTGSVTVALSADGGDFMWLQTASTPAALSMVTAMGEVAAETFEVRVTLGRDPVVDPLGHSVNGPTFRRWTMEAQPAPGRGEYIDVPFLLSDEETTRAELDEPIDIAGIYQRLLRIQAAGRPVFYQSQFGTVSVFLDDHEFIADKPSESATGGMQGTFIARMRRPRVRS